MEGTIEENVHRLAQQRQASMDLSAAVVKRQAGSKERGGLTIRSVLPTILFFNSVRTRVSSITLSRDVGLENKLAGALLLFLSASQAGPLARDGCVRV